MTTAVNAALKAAVTVDVATQQYPIAVVQEAAYALCDRAYVLLGPANRPGHVTVHLSPTDACAESPDLAIEFGEALKCAHRRRAVLHKGRAGAQALMVAAAGGSAAAAESGYGPSFKGGETTPGRFPVPYRWRRVAPDTVVISNDFGDWFLLSDADFERYANRAMSKGDPLYDALAERNLIGGSLQGAKVVREVRERLGWLHRGPFLHVVVLTLRCDHTCLYCHASRRPLTSSAGDHDMTVDTGLAVIDRIFEAPGQSLTIEFQGGEPLANFDVLRRMIDYAEAKNRVAKKSLSFALVTNTSLMTEERLDYLVAHRVQICTSLDGPADLHNTNRRLGSANSFDRTAHWIARINERYAELDLDTSLYRVEALLTVTRDTLERPEEVIDTYVALGCGSIFLRALNPFGFARKTSARIGYTMDEWLSFYRRALAYIIELNRDGPVGGNRTDIIERTAAIFLTKILAGTDPNYLDIRSPCGAGIGQLAYNYDGRVFTCDEGRMVAEGGDDLFAMGHAATDSYQTLIDAPVVRTMVFSSILDGVPGCTACAYKPFCGICPVHNYSVQGSLAGRMPESDWCAKHKGLLDHLFELIACSRTDPELADLLRRWTLVRPREHFVQQGA